MRDSNINHIYAAATALVSVVITYVTQRYRLTDLEECYIMLYDWDYVTETLSHPGGLAQLAASMLTQLMATPWVGALLTGMIYWLIMVTLNAITRHIGAPLWVSALSLLPIACLYLCLENNAYKYQGHTALLGAVVAIWLYCSVLSPKGIGHTSRKAMIKRAMLTLLLILITYWAVGSTTAVTVAAITIIDITRCPRLIVTDIVYIAVYLGMGYLAFRLQYVHTLNRALTPGMYYEWETTAYMMLYAWITTVVCITTACIFRNAKSTIRSSVILMACITLAVCITTWRLASIVHNTSVYRTMTQRYMAKHGDWDGILALDYGNDPTPFTSYRFLALAQKGQLAEQLSSTNPFIGYFMKNQALKKREDIEVLSDIFYECRYMGAARRYAFDTDIVTPGPFNPVETTKLAEINIATGDYKVAEKLISQLEKTLRYRQRAAQLRTYLYDDANVKADPVLGAMRRAIPADNAYMSPKGTLRDLRHIVSAINDNKIAQQFLEAFIVLTNYSEPDDEQYEPH